MAVAGNDDKASRVALQLHRFTSDVTLVTNDGALGLTPEAAGWLERESARGDGALASVRARDGEPGMLASLHSEDRPELPVEHLFSHQGATPQTALARSLGVE